jgi:hypothetical protein
MEPKTWGWNFQNSQAVWEEIAALIRPIKRILRHVDPSQLTGVPIQGVEFIESLPKIPAIYFLVSQKKGLVYIGKAHNLRAHWWPKEPLDHNYWPDLCHHRLKQAINQGDVTLHWMEVPPDQLGVLECLLIQIHQPAWNSRRG